MSVLFQSCIFSHPVVNFSALVLQVYLLKICRAMPRAVSSFFAVIKCAHAIFQISDRSQTLYKTVCITSWTECNFIQLYSSMLVKYMAAIQKWFLLFWSFNLLMASNTFVLNLLVFWNYICSVYIKIIEAWQAVETSYLFVTRITSQLLTTALCIFLWLKQALYYI